MPTKKNIKSFVKDTRRSIHNHIIFPFWFWKKVPGFPDFREFNCEAKLPINFVFCLSQLFVNLRIFF